MEVNYFIDNDHIWYMGLAYQSGKDICFDIEYKDGEEVHQLDIWIKAANLKADKKVFKVGGPKKYHKQVRKAFAGDYWEHWIKGVGLLAMSCEEIDQVEELNRKAKAWDELQAGQLSGFPIASFDEVMEQIENGNTTMLQEFVCEFHGVDGEDLMKRYTAFVLSWVKAGIGSTDIRQEEMQQAPTLIRYGYSEHCEHEYVSLVG